MKKAPRASPQPLRQLTADYPADGGWHHVAPAYCPEAASPFLAGERMAGVDLGRPMSPAHDGLAVLGGISHHILLLPKRPCALVQKSTEYG